MCIQSKCVKSIKEERANPGLSQIKKVGYTNNNK